LLTNKERIAELALHSRRNIHTDFALTAIENRCPECKELIAEKQKEYWEGRKPELIKLKEKQLNGEQLNGYESRALEEAEKHLKIIDDRKQDIKFEKEREETLAYLKQDSIDRAYSAAANGNIEFSSATDAAAFIGSTPNTVKQSATFEQLARCESKENDIDNIDQELNDREEDRDIDRSENDLLVEINHSENESQAYDDEYEYTPWNYSPPDEERVPEYQPR
jgi:hypothetical protein